MFTASVITRQHSLQCETESYVYTTVQGQKGMHFRKADTVNCDR